MQEIQQIQSRRIYVNTFLQRTLGDDVSMTVQLGRPFSFKSIRLDVLSMENFWTNFYQSATQNFSDFSFQYNNNVNPQDIIVKLYCNQYIGDTQTFTAYQSFQQWLETEVGNMNFIVENIGEDQTPWLNGVLKISADFNWKPIGQGWQKLGLIWNDSDPIFSEWIGTQASDFSQTAAVLVSIDNIQNGISSGQISSAFSVPNASQFGSKLTYTNTQFNTCQQITFQQQVTVDHFDLRFLNSDGQPLNTAQFNHSRPNQLRPEYILVFTVVE